MSDKYNAIKKLQNSVKSIKYNSNLDVKEINIGSPKEYLKLYHYLFLSYNPGIANEILDKHQMELSSKNDKSFIDGVYRLLRDMFDYVPKLTKDQFFSTSYAQVKANMAFDVIGLIQQRIKQTQPSASSGVMSTITSNGSSMASVASSNSRNNLKINFAKSLENNENLSPFPVKAGLKGSMSVQNHLASCASNTLLITKPKILPNKEPLVLREHHINYDPKFEQKSEVDDIEQIKINLDNETNNKMNIILEEISSKIHVLADRLNLIESRINIINKPTESIEKPKIEEDLVKLTKKDYENLLSRISILETEILIAKQKRYSVQKNETDFNDATAYETPMHSFFDSSNIFDNDVNNSVIQINPSISNETNPKEVLLNKRPGIICQGSPVDYDKIKANDSTLNEELTPTANTVKTSKLIGNSVANNGSLESKSFNDLNRVKELVMKASKLNQELNRKA